MRMEAYTNITWSYGKLAAGFDIGGKRGKLHATMILQEPLNLFH